MRKLGMNLRLSDYPMLSCVRSCCGILFVTCRDFPAVSVVTGQEFPALSVVTDFPAVSVLSGRDRKAFLAWEKTFCAAEKCPGIDSRIVYPWYCNFLTGRLNRKAFSLCRECFNETVVSFYKHFLFGNKQSR